MPKRLCNIRRIKRISAINWIESNGPHGKFMIILDDRYLLIYYTIINLKNKRKNRITFLSNSLKCFSKWNGNICKHIAWYNRRLTYLTYVTPLKIWIKGRTDEANLVVNLINNLLSFSSTGRPHKNAIDVC
jgi:hypothetical protein